MQANNSSRIHEEFELSSRTIGIAQQRDGSEADVVHEEHDDSDKSITPSPSGRIERRPLRAHANEQDAKAILLRKHVPLIVLPDFDQNARDCGHTQDTQGPGRMMSPDRNGGHRETRSDDGHDALGELRDERPHRAPSPWVATFFDVRLPVPLFFLQSVVLINRRSLSTAHLCRDPRHILNHARTHKRRRPSPLLHFFRPALVELARAGDL